MIFKQLIYFQTFFYKETTIQFPVSVQANTMEEVILRFPHLSVQIFQELDVQSLANCKEVSGSWANLIETEKPLNDIFVIMRLIHQYWNWKSSLTDWVENNIQFIRYKFKQKGIGYNICYMKIIIPGYLKKLLICEQELKPKPALL